LEAQAMGLPTIATNRGGIPEEVTDESAIIVSTEQNFVEGLANAIRRLYNTPQECSNMAMAAKCNAVRYNKERFACDFFKALESKS
jgi:glycosyltransferase involved in cell wall biosynthesis